MGSERNGKAIAARSSGDHKSQTSKMIGALCVGGAYSHSPVNHIDTRKSWASVMHVEEGTFSLSRSSECVTQHERHSERMRPAGFVCLGGSTFYCILLWMVGGKLARDQIGRKKVSICIFFKNNFATFLRENAII